MLDLPLLKSLCVGSEEKLGCFLKAECFELQGEMECIEVME